MIDGTYKIEIDLPLGHKEGTLVLRSEGDVAYADIDAPLIGKRQIEGTCDGDTFTGEGSGKVQFLGNLEYTLQGEVSGDNIHIDLQTNKGDYAIEGVRA